MISQVIFICFISNTFGYEYDEGRMDTQLVFNLRIRIFIRKSFFIQGPVMNVTKCPGYYCGRHVIEIGNQSMWSACGSCPRGSRVKSNWQCTECDSSPNVYDWMYLCFMVLVGMTK